MDNEKEKADIAITISMIFFGSLSTAGLIFVIFIYIFMKEI